MDEFAKAREDIEKEIDGLKQGNPAERDYKSTILDAKLNYYEIVSSEGLIRSIDDAAREVNTLKNYLAHNMLGINSTSEKLNKSINLTAGEIAVFKEALIKSNENLSSAQAGFQRMSNWLTGLICVATILNVGFTGWLIFETQVANHIQRVNQDRELTTKKEYKALVLENLLVEIDTNLSLIEQIINHISSDQIKEVTTGRFHTYYLDKVKDIYVEKIIRSKAIDLLNDVEQGNRYFDALNNSEYIEYFDSNLIKFNEFVAITKIKFVDLKTSISEVKITTN